MTSALAFSFPAVLAALLDGRNLAEGEMTALMEELMSGRAGEAETAAVLVALRAKGETPAELAAAARVLRRHMLRLDPGRAGVLDTCGTGGDGTGTFNISTAAALVVAGCGVPVVKHGNRAVSSQSGSADVLAALGVRVEGDLPFTRRCLDRAGLAFCFAPHFHPALRHVAPVRRRLGVRTLFNLLGPLANPAGADFQVLGVGRPDLLDTLAAALSLLGPRRALLVSGKDGLDEVSLAGPTFVREVAGSRVRAWEWTPDDFGLAPCDTAVLRVPGAAESAAVIRGILAGDDGPPTRVVLANAAAALVAVGRAATPREAVALAADSLASGRARRVLDQLLDCSRQPPAPA